MLKTTITCDKCGAPIKTYIPGENDESVVSWDGTKIEQNGSISILNEHGEYIYDLCSSCKLLVLEWIKGKDEYKYGILSDKMPSVDRKINGDYTIVSA